MSRNTNIRTAQIGPEDPIPLWLAVASSLSRCIIALRTALTEPVSVCCLISSPVVHSQGPCAARTVSQLRVFACRIGAALAQSGLTKNKADAPGLLQMLHNEQKAVADFALLTWLPLMLPTLESGAVLRAYEIVGQQCTSMVPTDTCKAL